MLFAPFFLHGLAVRAKGARGQSAGRIRYKAESKPLANLEGGIERLHLGRSRQKKSRVLESVSPIGLNSGLHEDHGPAARLRVNAKEKARVVGAFDVNLPMAKIVRIEWLQKVLVVRLTLSGRERHAKPLVDVIDVAQPFPSRLLAGGIVADVNCETG